MVTTVEILRWAIAYNDEVAKQGRPSSDQNCQSARTLEIGHIRTGYVKRI